MDAYAATHGDKVNVLLLNIEGVEKAKKFKPGKLSNVKHGGIPSQGLPDEFGLAYIPHHVIIGTDGKVIVNYNGFSFDKVPEPEVKTEAAESIFASASAPAPAPAPAAEPPKVTIQWCGG